MKINVALLWSLIKAGFLALGGFAGLSRIWDWVHDRPKIVGQLEQIISADRIPTPILQNTMQIGTQPPPPPDKIFLILLYVVNVRPKPTTIRGWHLWVKKDGKWTELRPEVIPNNFKIPLPYPTARPINFYASRLYEKAGEELLEYGKGVRGWLLFTSQHVTKEDFKKGPKKIIANDAFGRKHRIPLLAIHHAEEGEMKYFPGAGIDA